MAKKNSTKTATKEALQASEPRTMSFKGWQGINIKESPLEWQPVEYGEQNDTALKPNYLVVQNNVNTTSSLALEVRHDTRIIANAPNGKKLIGVSCLYRDYLVCAFSDMSLAWTRMGTDEWHDIEIIDPDGGSANRQWSCIYFYQKQLICMTTGKEVEDHEMFTGDININEGLDKFVDSVSSVKKASDPVIKPKLVRKGDLGDARNCRIQVTYVYTNKFGSTRDSYDNWETIYVDVNPGFWHSGKYLEISGNAKDEYGSTFYSDYKISGVDIYCTWDDNNDAIFAGHADVDSTTGAWVFQWLGAMIDTSSWNQSSMTIPEENTTKGVNASYVRNHDGRLYFWGGSEEYRLWMGGNPGSELSVARGIGGAWVDIEPGAGTEIRGTAKFKTYNGASIVTIMCSNPNSGKVKRFNLLETNITVSNELASKGFMTEEVANVVGSTSNYGFGAWADGLYTVNRYGLMVTTMAMESSNQLRAISVSDNIAPVFSDHMANRLHNCHLMFINDVVYLTMGQEYGTDLDRMILCYDIDKKAWYTYTYDLNERVLSIMNIDSEDHEEGIGIITENRVALIPTTGSQEANPPMFEGSGDDAFEVSIETGELSVRQPVLSTTYVAQLEFRFDYFVGELDITVEGYDYYGRYRTIKKVVKVDEYQRNYPVYMRVDELLETYKVTLKGKARFRLTHFNVKLYQQSNKIDLVYGYTDHSYYEDRDGGITDIHHYLDSYNNLRRAILP